MKKLTILKKQFTKYILLNKYGILICLFLFFSSNLFGQTKKFRVFFKDKGPEQFLPGSAIYDSTEKLLSKRAIDRRKKNMNGEQLFTIEDAPLYKPYIDELESNNCKILLKLRWSNYAVIEFDSVNINIIKSLPFVNKIQTASSKLLPQEIRISSGANNIITNDYGNDILSDNCGTFDYGLSYLQAQVLNVPLIHSLGITGSDVMLGFIDSGFRWRSNLALGNISVLDEFDFIKNDKNTAYEEAQDTIIQDHHGTLVLSVAAGYLQGAIIGIAPSANYLLAKTENIRSENHFEEDCYAAALEWLEAAGADIISSSLGYKKFNDSLESYIYAELNGNTTISSRAINYAAARGVVCVASAGNEGPGIGTIITPGDADSAITVGAVIKDGSTPAEFTSRGPRWDGKIKPEVSALGFEAYAAFIDGAPKKMYGTSLSAPAIAASTALILSAFPELNSWQIKNLLYSSAPLAEEPNNDIGRGVPDVFLAMKNAGIIISPIATLPMNQYQRVFVHIASANPIYSASLAIRFAGKSNFDRFQLYKTALDYLFAADVPINLFSSEAAECYILVQDMKSNRRMPNNEDCTITVIPGSVVIPCGVDPTLLPTIDENITKAYLYPSTVVGNRSQIELNISLEKESSINYELYNILGQKIFSEQIPLRESGMANIAIPIYNLGSGGYFIRVQYLSREEVVCFNIIR